MGVPLKRGRQNLKLSTHETFRIGKYKGKINYDLFQVTQLESPAQKGPSKCLTTKTRQIKFST